ncbi:MAG TPA: hypothetical protein VH700_10900 [Gemmatimonadales bacterium]
MDTIGRPSCAHRFFDLEAWRRRTRRGASFAAILLGACVGGGRQGIEPAAPARSADPVAVPDPSSGLQVPGTFSSGGSCGGDWGDEVYLTLLPDGVFSLRQTYRDDECAPQLTLLYIGRWNMAENGRQVRLDNGPVWLRRLTIVNRRTLRIPDPPEGARPALPVYQTSYPGRLLPFRDPFRLQGPVSLTPRSQ